MVRNVFKIRSLSRRRTCYCNANRRMLEKRWSTVKSYLCGDEWNSIVAEKDSDSPSISVSVSISGIQNHNHQEEEEEFISSDSIWGSNKIRTGILSDDDFELCSNYDGEDDDDDDDDYSIKSSEATITQPMNIVLLVCGEGSDKKRGRRRRTEKSNSTRKLFQQEDAAIIIQSAFRKYLARRQFRNGDGNVMQEGVLPIPSPSESLKVQTGGDSTDTTTTISSSFHIKEKHKIVCKSTQKRVKPQEEWDDSTVSSSISRKRLQNKIDAATRRERALAYAFAQQLRICSKKRTKCSSNRLEENENKSSSLNWLERWMATRDIERSSSRFMMDDDDETHSIIMNNSMSINEGNKYISSGGSNQLSLQIHGFSLKAPRRPPAPANKNKPKPPPTLTNISTRKTLPTLHPHPPKAGKKSCTAEQEKHKKDKLKQYDSKKSVKFQDSSSIITQ